MLTLHTPRVLRRAVFPSAAPVEAAGGGAGGWLAAAHHRGVVSDWYAAVADMVGWKLADWEIALRMMGKRKARAQRRVTQHASAPDNAPSL